MAYLREMLGSYVDAYEELEFDDGGWFEVLKPIINDAFGVPEAFQDIEPILSCEPSDFSGVLFSQINNANDDQINAYVEHTEREIAK